MNDLQWGTPRPTPSAAKGALASGHSQAELLAEDLGCPALYLHYNTGRHISANGQDLAALMQTLVEHWPVPLTELVVIAHSMGGLVARSACEVARQRRLGWLSRLRQLVFLGTPHQGAPLERGGNWFELVLGISPYTAPFARLGKVRSAGITDMRYGNLRDADWMGRDRFARDAARPQPVPLPRRVKCYAIAATTNKRAGGLGEHVVGDGLVPVDSALGRGADAQSGLDFAGSHTWVAYGMNHFDLLNHPQVFERLRRWLAPVREHDALPGAGE
jgi:pimeloyl-ACP methyl ester carboxylesterase